MLRVGAERILQRVKRDPSYRIHDGLPLRAILEEFAFRGASVLRGFWKLRGVPGGRLRFVEPGVVIQHRSMLAVGDGTVLERGVLLRCLSRDGFKFGNHVTIGRHTIVEGTGVLWHLAPGFSIGDYSSLGDWSFVGCGGGVTIGNRVIMGQRISMHSQNHNFSDDAASIQEQGVTSKGITIEDNCWLGAGVIVLDGVVIGEGSVIAAGSVLTKSCAPNSIMAGNPARLVRSRIPDPSVPGRDPA